MLSIPLLAIHAPDHWPHAPLFATETHLNRLAQLYLDIQVHWLLPNWSIVNESAIDAVQVVQVGL